MAASRRLTANYIAASLTRRAPALRCLAQWPISNHGLLRVFVRQLHQIIAQRSERNMAVSKLSIGVRLGAGFAVIAALALGAAGLGLMQLSWIGAQFTRIVEVNNPKGDLANQMLNELGLMGMQVRMIALLSLPAAIDAETKVMNASIDHYQQAETSVAKAIAADPTATDTERELIKAIQAAALEVVPLIKEAAAQGADGASV